MKLSKTTAMVLIVVVVGLVATLLAGPPDVRAQVLAGLGGLGALLLATMRPILTRDANHNGIADWIERLLERVFGIGGGPPPPGAGAVLLLIAAGLASFCQGCGGGQLHTYRVGVEEYAEGVAIVDEAIARRVDAAAPEARAQVRAEVASRQILGTTAQETADLALARYDEIMRPLEIASEAARYAAAGARAMDRALDTWAAVESRQTFLVRVACGVAAVMRLAEAVLAAGIELPARATSVVETLATWSDESCPEGGAW